MKILLFANTEWYLYNFRRGLALALRDAGHDVLLLSPAGDYGERLTALGLRWVAVPMLRRSLNPLREFGLLFWLWRLIRRERADLVHGFTIKCAVYGSVAARLAGVRARVSAVTGLGYVFTSDELHARRLRPLVRAALVAALTGRGTRIILQNPDDVELFVREVRIAPERIALIRGSGVDCRRFQPKLTPALHHAEQRRFRVLVAARLLWDKGLGELVDAARQLRSEGRAVDVLIAGDPDPGNPAAVPESLVNAWVAEGLIEWLGHVDDMPTLYRSVDAVVLPSYREGLPKGLIEAAACGLPLITTDVPGCREVVTDGVNGLLVPVRDASAIAAAIVRLAEDPPLCARLGKAAQENAQAEFDERSVISRTLDVYIDLFNETTRSTERRIKTEDEIGIE